MICRPIAGQDPSCERTFAACLSNFALILGRVGRHEDAVSTMEEGVDVQQRLAARDPEAHEPGLAMSLENLAVQYRGAGNGADALLAIQKAVNINRRLARSAPEIFKTELALSLGWLATILSDAHRDEEADQVRAEVARLDAG